MTNLSVKPETLHPTSPEDIAALDRAVRSMERKSCLLGTSTGKTGLEVICEILGYVDLGSFHKKELKRIEAINPYIASHAIAKSRNRGGLVNDDIHEARKILAKRYNFLEFDKAGFKRIWIWARGHFKSTIVSISHTIQLILIDPNIRILLMHHKLEKAKDLLKVIKEHFMCNQRFRDLFPEYCPKANKFGEILWDTSERVTIPNRTIQGLQEPTVDVSGTDTIKTGSHYDYIKKDDLVTEKSVTSEIMLKQSIDADSMTKSLFDNPERGPEDYIGTRYHFADMYSHKLKSIPPQYQSVIPCYDEDSNPVFYERFTRDGLENVRREQGSYVFSTQYLLSPLDPEKQIFQMGWIQFYEKKPDLLNTYLMVDPANSKKKRSDYTAMLVVGIDNKENYYILDIVRDKLDVNERVAKVFYLAGRWDIRKCLYESVGFQETDVKWIKEARNETFNKFPIEEIKTQNIAKEDRVRALQPLFERGQVFIPRSIFYTSKHDGRSRDLVEDFLLEYQTFPLCEHDDMLDAMSMLMKIKVNRVVERIAPKTFLPGTWGYELKRFHNRFKNDKLLVCK